MRSFQTYFDETRSISDDFNTLCDPNFSHSSHREAVNDCVMNFVLKYLGAYLDLPDGSKAEAIQEALAKRLETQQEETNFFGLMTGENLYGDSDLFSIQCLGDLHSTAAIFKEIAFAEDFDNQSDSFFGLDWGTGSGILLAAMLVASQRRKLKKTLAVGIDLQKKALENASRACSRFSSEENFRFEFGDACDPLLHLELVGGAPLSMWVSETISMTTPHLFLDQNGRVQVDQSMPSLALFNEMDDTMDPYPKILSATLAVSPLAYSRLMRRKMFMFPNPVNATYRPDGAESTLALKTEDGTARLLPEIGSEFSEYQDLRAVLEAGRWKVGELTAEITTLLDRLFSKVS